MAATLTGSFWLSNPRLMIGIMTGTSMDCVDVVLAKFSSDKDAKLSFEIIADYSEEFPSELKKQILNLIENSVHVSLLSQINFQLSHIYFSAIKKLCDENSISPESVDAIGIHGQTVWHKPRAEGGNFPSTLQLGSISALAQLTKITTVGNFRAADIALGGNGAPLAPIFDYYFLSDAKESRIILNIGGISNITYLSAGCSINDVIAFDTGPGNVLIDRAMNIFYNKAFDDEGKVARNGNLIVNLFNALKNTEYILKSPPKSTGRELFNDTFLRKYLDKIDSYNLPKEDILNTLTMFTAWSITENIRLFSPNFDRLIISGGGVKNVYLIELLSDVFPHKRISKSDEFGIPAQLKEALCFAYLAYRTLGGLAGNVPSATGSFNEAILGEIAFC